MCIHNIMYNIIHTVCVYVYACVPTMPTYLPTVPTVLYLPMYVLFFGFSRLPKRQWGVWEFLSSPYWLLCQPLVQPMELFSLLQGKFKCTLTMLPCLTYYPKSHIYCVQRYFGICTDTVLCNQQQKYCIYILYMGLLSLY